jgi:hypothetical protein
VITAKYADSSSDKRNIMAGKDMRHSLALCRLLQRQAQLVTHHGFGVNPKGPIIPALHRRPNAAMACDEASYCPLGALEHTCVRAHRRVPLDATPAHENTDAIRKAAPAASPPIKVVCRALRIGRVPVKWPLMYPKTRSAARVTMIERTRLSGIRATIL